MEPILATPIDPLSSPISPLQKTVSTPTLQASTQQIAPPIISNTPPIIAVKPSTAPVAPPVQVPAKPVQKADLTNEMQSFKASLRTKIKQLLQYPPSARRRGMEGEVNVHFVLENTGAIHDITINQGESIFHDAAKLAVASASGIKIPDQLSESFPKEMQLTLKFKLD
jgi:protein TonB